MRISDWSSDVCSSDLAGGYQFLPDRRQLVDFRTEQVDTLATGDLGVEPVLLRDHADRDQLVGGDLAARHARHDRVRAVLLDVGEVRSEEQTYELQSIMRI